MQSFKVDNLTVQVYPNRTLMGQDSAKDIANAFASLLQTKSTINVIFAAAPSQNDVLQALVEDKTIEWNRINAFHMDEYIGLDKSAPQGFGNFLKAHIFGKVNFASVNYIDVSAKDENAEALRYSKVISDNPPDIVIMGIGENGHIAFNDPPVADFADSKVCKPVKLDEVCRQQQVNDGCFDSINQVPKYALTLTCPTLYGASKLFCIVPCKTKAKAVFNTLNGEIGEHCPATILRKHGCAKLYLDSDSAELLK